VQPKRHHYIPVFYTKRWARAADGKIVEWSRPHKEVVPRFVHPAGTGYLDRLYEMAGLGPAFAQQIEELFFKPVDSLASDALTLLEGGPQDHAWKRKLRSAWTRFLLSLLLRCPEDIEAIRHYWAVDFKKTTPESEARYAAARSEDDPLTFAEYLDGIPNVETEKSLFRSLLSLVDNQNVGAFINQMHWHVVDTSSHREQLLTSDRPVIRTNGIKEPGGHIALPIGPNLLFIAANDPVVIDQIARVPTKELVRASNAAVVEGAHRFVYSRDTAQENFIRKWHGQTPQARIVNKDFFQRAAANAAKLQE
jgi:hypothetical protein